MTRERIQEVLDGVLAEHSVKVYWRRRSQDQAERGEYVVYSMADNSPDFHADDIEQSRSSEWNVVYYYPDDLIETVNGRAYIDSMVKVIKDALGILGFSVRYFDGDDFEAIGCETTIFDCRE